MAHSCTCIRHCRLASPRVNEPYAHRQRACDSRNYRRVIVEISTYRSMEVLHGVFYVRYNNRNYHSPIYRGFT